MKRTYEFNSLKLNENEMDLLKQAVDMMDDMINDSVLDEIDSTWVSKGEELIVTHEKSKEIRKQVNDAIDKLLAINTLKEKLGFK
jgi:hypothetical protein